MTPRNLLQSLLIFCLSTGIAPPIFAQDKLDRLDFLDETKNKKETRNGSIVSEDPVKVVILSGANRTRLEIPVSAVIEVSYGVEPAEVIQARTAERNKKWSEARTLYRDALRKSPADHKFLRPHLTFKIAKATAQQAELDASARPTAIDELRKFHKAHGDSRHTMECLDLLSRLLLVEGKPTQEVVEGYRQLKSKFSGTYRELAGQCDLLEARLSMLEAQALFKSKPDDAKKKYAELRTHLETLVQRADKNNALELRINLAECNAVLGKSAEAIKELDGLLAKANDPRTFAAAYLGRGDCYRLTSQPREAMWDYLWVDVLYNEDAEQHAKALYHLVEVFDALKEAAHAKACRDRLRTEPQLAATRYRSLLKKE